MSTVAFEKRWNPTLSLNRSEFIEKVTGGIPPKPPAMEANLRANQGRD